MSLLDNISILFYVRLRLFHLLFIYPVSVHLFCVLIWRKHHTVCDLDVYSSDKISLAAASIFIHTLPNFHVDLLYMIQMWLLDCDYFQPKDIPIVNVHLLTFWCRLCNTGLLGHFIILTDGISLLTFWKGIAIRCLICVLLTCQYWWK